jgi:hypothetical protein
MVFKILTNMLICIYVKIYFLQALAKKGELLLLFCYYLVMQRLIFLLNGAVKLSN